MAGEKKFPEEKEKFRNHIGNIVKVFRSKRGMSLGDVSKKAGYSRTFISQIEHSKVIPNTFTLYKIADALNIPYQLFFQSSLIHEKEDVYTKAKKSEFEELAQKAYLNGTSVEVFKKALELAGMEK